jgi:hypothetical protein
MTRPAKPPHVAKVYPGPWIDANSLKDSGQWKNQQAIVDALYIMCAGAFACVENDAAQNPRIPNVTDNAFAQSIGGFSYLQVFYGYPQHPPSNSTAQVVAAYTTWAAANLHTG